MEIQTIDDPRDIRISAYRDLKDKSWRQNDAFIIEGKFILETLLLRSRFRIASVLIAEDRLSTLQDVLHHVPAPVPVYVASQAIMAAIAGFDMHRGILAAGIADAAHVNLPAHLNRMNRVAVLSNISNPDNIGSIFRNAAGLGIEAVLLDAQCSSPLYRKAIRVSMGACLTLPWSQSGNIVDIIETLATEGMTVYALSLQSAQKLEDVHFAERCAFVLGEEAHGLPQDVQRLCHGVMIPMAAGIDSLNVAVTSAIVFHAARRTQAV